MAKKEAKAGIKNENDITDVLNHFPTTEASQWLGAFGYDVKKIKEVKAETSRNYKPKGAKKKLGNIKSDIILTVDNGKPHGVQVKTSRVNWNHVRRVWADKICEEWNAPTFISNALKKFTGNDGLRLLSREEIKKLRTKRKERGLTKKEIKRCERYKRILLPELKERKKVFAWFEENKKKIVDSVLCGKDIKYRPRHLMVTERTGTSNYARKKRIGIVSMSKAVTHFAKGDVEAGDKGMVLKIGKISMKIKGALKSDKNAKQLQFTIPPLGVFDMPRCEIFPKKKPKKTKRDK